MLKSRTIILCGQRWKIRVYKNDDGFAGHMFPKTRTIEISKDNAFDDTIIHELFHAALYSHGCDYVCSNGNGVPGDFAVLNHSQLKNVVQDVWGALTQIYEMRVRK